MKKPGNGEDDGDGEAKIRGRGRGSPGTGGGLAPTLIVLKPNLMVPTYSNRNLLP